MTSPADPDRVRAIDFVTTGGARTGLGHVMRCTTLAVEAKRRGWRVRAYLEGDEVGTRIWRERTGRSPDGRWRDWRPCDGDPIVALDHPEAKDDWLERIEHAALRSLVIDDERPTRRLPDWRLLPGLHHSIRVGALAASDQTIELVGGRYAILANLHRTIPARDHDQRHRLLVSLGGADPHSFTPLLVRAVHEALGHTQACIEGVDLVLGPAFQDPRREIRDSIAALGLDVHLGLAPEAMGALMAQARLAVVGFGTSLTELAWHRTPFLCVPHHRSDLAPARSLEAVGIGRVLGDGSLIEPDTVVPRLIEALEDDAWRRSSAARARAALAEARGERLLFDHLEGGARRLTFDGRVDQPGEGTYRLGGVTGAGSFD